MIYGFLIILAVALVFLWLIFKGVGKKEALSEREKEQVARVLSSMEELLASGDNHAYAKAVIEGDKLLDFGLMRRGFRGETMGERLKATTTLNNINDIWWAHKLRNQIAHELDVNIREAEARKAVSIFKQALRGLRII